VYLAVPLSTHFKQELMADWIVSWVGMVGSGFSKIPSPGCLMWMLGYSRQSGGAAKRASG